MFEPLGMSLSEIQAELLSRGIKMPKMRAEQLYNWIYKIGINNIELASNLDNDLKSMVSLAYLHIKKSLTSVDGTEKFLLKLQDNKDIEVVLIHTEHRHTLCVSSQVGCAMGCKFCNTGTQGFDRNLSASEIIAQFLTIKNLGREITNIVFMGMGEPLDNFTNLEKALLILTDQKGIGFPKNKITVSTSGLIDGIEKLAPLKIPLSVSLHAADDEKRSKIMPINARYPLQLLMTTINAYRESTHIKKISLEYIMINGVNDTSKDAIALIKLLGGKKYKINLIPFNDWGHKIFKPSPPENILNFQSILKKSSIQCNIRKSAGLDIMAACGELKSSIAKETD